MEITNKVVLITGASGGIGLATAHLFSQKGAKLALAARSSEKLAQIVLEMSDASPSQPTCATTRLFST